MHLSVLNFKWLICNGKSSAKTADTSYDMLHGRVSFVSNKG